MNAEKNQLHFLFRKPKLPVIVCIDQDITAVKTLQKLANILLDLKIIEASKIIIIDLTGEEFWFNYEYSVLSPGFAYKKWTKKKIIEIYNRGHKEEQMTYSTASISNKRFDKLIIEICDLLLARDEV